MFFNPHYRYVIGQILLQQEQILTYYGNRLYRLNRHKAHGHCKHAAWPRCRFYNHEDFMLELQSHQGAVAEVRPDTQCWYIMSLNLTCLQGRDSYLYVGNSSSSPEGGMPDYQPMPFLGGGCEKGGQIQ